MCGSEYWSGAWAGMKQLENLDLSWCSGITDADVKALAALTAITGLQLSRTLVSHSKACNFTLKVSICTVSLQSLSSFLVLVMGCFY